MKIYLAGRLNDGSQRELLERMDLICKELGFDTFLPHRDVGLARGHKDVQRIFKEDILKGLDSCDLVVASLEGLHVGAGTAWEMGYAYSKGLPLIGFKSDESPEEGLEYLSSIILATTKFVKSFKELKKELAKLV